MLRVTGNNTGVAAVRQQSGTKVDLQDFCDKVCPFVQLLMARSRGLIIPFIYYIKKKVYRNKESAKQNVFSRAVLIQILAESKCHGPSRHLFEQNKDVVLLKNSWTKTEVISEDIELYPSLMGWSIYRGWQDFYKPGNGLSGFPIVTNR